MITYKYNKKEDIFYVTRSGNITFDDILNYIDEIDSRYKHFGRLYLLSDARNSNINYSINDFPQFIKEIKKRAHSYLDFLEATVVDKPLATAYATFFSELTKDLKNYKYGVFSSVEAAKKWLLTNKAEIEPEIGSEKKTT